MTITTTEAKPAQGVLAVLPDQTDWTDGQLAALRQIGVEEASRGDRIVFLNYAQRTGLDPFTSQICMVGRWDPKLQAKKQTIQVQIAGLRVLAQRTNEFAGRLGPFWCGPDKQWTDVWVDDLPPVAARTGIMRKGFAEPLWNVCLWKEFVATTSQGAVTAMWRNKGVLMLGKCSEAGALRAAFPMDLSGLYIPEEFDQDNAAVTVEQVPQDAPTSGAAEVEPAPAVGEVEPDSALAVLAALAELKDVQHARELFRLASKRGWLHEEFGRVPLKTHIVTAQDAKQKGKPWMMPPLGEPVDDGVVDADVVDDFAKGAR